jgi:hypothetical protein
MNHTKFLLKQIEDKFDHMENYSKLIGKNKYNHNYIRQLNDILYFMHDANMLESYSRALRDKLEND